MVLLSCFLGKQTSLFLCSSLLIFWKYIKNLTFLRFHPGLTGIYCPLHQFSPLLILLILLPSCIHSYSSAMKQILTFLQEIHDAHRKSADSIAAVVEWLQGIFTQVMCSNTHLTDICVLLSASFPTYLLNFVVFAEYQQFTWNYFIIKIIFFTLPELYICRFEAFFL